MPEALRDHELKRLCSAGGIASDHGILGHDLSHGSYTWVERLGSDLLSDMMYCQTYPESKILGGEDTAEAFLLIDNENTV